MTITREEILASGRYKKYTGGSCKLNRSDALYQYIFRLDGVTFYAINIWEYDFTQFPSSGKDYGLDCEVILYDRYHKTVRIHLSPDEFISLGLLEAYIAEMYTNLGCVPDIHNN